MTDLESLRNFFVRYGEALAGGDLPGISRCYEVPALVMSDEGSIPVASREEIEAAFDGAAERHRSRGLVAARPEIISSEEITARISSVDVGWDYLDEQGNSAEQDGYRYIVRLDHGDEPMIQTVIAAPGIRPLCEGGVDPVPEGFHTVTPYMVIKEAAKAIEFYKDVFGAKEIFRLEDADGGIRHAEVVIGDSPVMITDESAEFGMRGPEPNDIPPVNIFLYVEDADEIFDRAISAGAMELVPMEDAEDGDRRGGITDPFGHVWHIATHIEGISREELQKRYEGSGRS
ncbi:MAG: VOC family protein [Rubrobacteraceae bacterium]